MSQKLTPKQGRCHLPHDGGRPIGRDIREHLNVSLSLHDVCAAPSAVTKIKRIKPFDSKQRESLTPLFTPPDRSLSQLSLGIYLLIFFTIFSSREKNLTRFKSQAHNTKNMANTVRRKHSQSLRCKEQVPRGLSHFRAHFVFNATLLTRSRGN